MVNVLKATFFAAMLLGLGYMWLQRHWVIDAYTTDAAPAELRLSGVALDFEKTEIPASPYAVRTADDSRRRPLSLLFAQPVVEPVIMIDGESKIEGAVRLAGEGAPGAVVLIERHTSSGLGAVRVPTDDEGRFVADDLPGGRFRVRAWLPDRATMTASDVFRLEAGESTERLLELSEIDHTSVVEFVNGGTMYRGLTGSFGVVVSRPSIDEDGIVITAPVVGRPVTVEFVPRIEVLSSAAATTDDRGLARFDLRCLAPGEVRATVTYIPPPEPVGLTASDQPPTATDGTEPNPAGGQGRAAGAGRGSTSPSPQVFSVTLPPCVPPPPSAAPAAAGEGPTGPGSPGAGPTPGTGTGNGRGGG